MQPGHAPLVATLLGDEPHVAERAPRGAASLFRRKAVGLVLGGELVEMKRQLARELGVERALIRRGAKSLAEDTQPTH